MAIPANSAPGLSISPKGECSFPCRYCGNTVFEFDLPENIPFDLDSIRKKGWEDSLVEYIKTNFSDRLYQTDDGPKLNLTGPECEKVYGKEEDQ